MMIRHEVIGNLAAERDLWKKEFMAMKGEVERLTAVLAEKDAEVEKLTHERDLWENMAAMRLADQEAIERHVTKRVAGEIVDIMNHCETFQDVKAVIWQKYGVE